MAEVIRSALFCDSADVTFTEVECPNEINAVFYPATESEQRDVKSSTWASLSLEYWSRIIEEARVDLAAFGGDPESDLITSSYLADIVETDNTSPVQEPVTNPRKTYTYNVDDVVIRRPPYSYSALMIAAFYLSGNKTLTTGEVKKGVSSLFPAVYNRTPSRWRAVWVSGIMAALRTRMFATSEGKHSLVPEFIYERIMKKVCLKERDDMDKYGGYLHTHLGHPDMIDNLHEAELKRSCTTVAAPAISASREMMVADVVNGLATVAVKRPLEDTQESMRKRVRLELPARLCYQGDRVTDIQTDAHSLLRVLEPSLRDTGSRGSELN